MGIVGMVGGLRNKEYKIIHMAILGIIISGFPFILIGWRLFH